MPEKTSQPTASSDTSANLKVYPSIILKKDREKSVMNRHPWLFTGAVQRVEGAKDGDVVAIRSLDGQVLAYGHYAANTQIVARIFAFVPPHTAPESIVIDDTYWLGKFRRAWQMRQSLLDSTRTTGYRLFHAEGDGLPGIIADVYNNVVSVQVRTTGTRKLMPLLTRFLTEEAGFAHVFYKAVAHEKEDSTGEWATAAPTSEEALFIENNLKFAVNVETGQKTGFFLDQRDNRALLGQYVRGLRVANLFAYTGGFSVYALAGGAKEVVSIDISESACRMAERNAVLNFGAEAPHTALKADCFDFLKNMAQGAFDAIVLDPPAFTKSIATVDKAARGYKDINMRAMRALPEGGLLFTFSCSQHISRDLFQKIIYAAAKDAGREVQVIGHASQGADHPMSIYHPEGEYLKGLLLRVW